MAGCAEAKVYLKPLITFAIEIFCREILNLEWVKSILRDAKPFFQTQRTGGQDGYHSQVNNFGSKDLASRKRTGIPVTDIAVRQAWDRLRTTDLTFHDLRHEASVASSKRSQYPQAWQ